MAKRVQRKLSSFSPADQGWLPGGSGKTLAGQMSKVSKSLGTGVVLTQLGRPQLLLSSTLEWGPLQRSHLEGPSQTLLRKTPGRSCRLFRHSKPSTSLPLLFRSCPPPSVDINIFATWARGEVILTSFSTSPASASKFGAWFLKQLTAERWRQAGKQMDCTHQCVTG